MLFPWMIAPAITFKFYLMVLLMVSPICFVLYGLDKWRAVRQEARIPERTLHVAAFVGGWPGAWLGQRVFHHKSHKLSFRIIFWLIVGCHLCFLFLSLLSFLFS